MWWPPKNDTGPRAKDQEPRSRGPCRREPRTVYMHAWTELWHARAKSQGPKSKSHKDQEEPRIMLGSN